MRSLSEEYQKLFSTDDLHNRHRLSFELIEKITDQLHPKDKRQEKMKQLSFVAHFLEISDLLREQNIWFASIKGPLLSQRIYGDATARTSHDIDLLIHPEDVNRVRSLVSENGYNSISADWPSGEARQKKMITLQHHVSFYHLEKKYIVEFHWRLSSYMPISQTRHENQLSPNFTEILFKQKAFTVLAKEYELMYLILHGSAHAWFRLKWVVDILHYPTDGFDKDLFFHLVKTHKLERALALISELLKIYFNVEFFEEESKQASKKLIDYCQKRINSERIIYSSTIEIMESILYKNRLFPSFSSWIKMIRFFWIRPGDLVEYNFKFLWMYYMIRPFSYILRRGIKLN